MSKHRRIRQIVFAYTVCLLNTRQRVALQTNAEACQNCHALINPLGFTLENFDAVGRFRSVERDRPIDASGYYRTLTGEQIEFRGSRQLAEFLARSDEVYRSFVEQLFHQTVKQPVSAYGPAGNAAGRIRGVGLQHAEAAGRDPESLGAAAAGGLTTPTKQLLGR